MQVAPDPVRPHPTAALAAVAVVGGLLAGCDEDSTISRLAGRLELRREGAGTPIERLDLGPLPVGVPISVPLEAVNVGTRVVEVCVERTGCASPSRVEPEAGFRLVFGGVEDGRWPVGAGDARGFDLRFSALVVGPVAAELVLVHDGQAGPELRVPVSAEGVTPDVRLEPERLDFGEVTVGRQRQEVLTLQNGSAFAQPIRLSTAPDDGVRFGLLDAAGGTVPLGEALETQIPAQGTRDVQVFFQPDEERSFTSTLTVSWCDGPECARAVGLTGQGVKPAFSLEPALVDFGDIDEAAETRATVQIRNLSDRYGVTIERLEIPGVAPWFSLAAPDPLPHTVPAGAVWPVEVVYRGVEPAEHEGRIQVYSNAWDNPDTDVDESRAEVSLRGRTMGPNIAVFPERVRFGTVPIAATPAVRVAVIQNVGTAPLTVSDVAFDAASAELSLPDGLPSLPRVLGPGEGAEVRMAYRPEDAGEDLADLTVVSDDRDEPRVVVGVNGLGGVPTTCALAVAPSLVTFGLVERGRIATLPVELRNLGAQPCHLTGANLTGDAELGLAAPLADPTRIQPGQRLRVDVTYAPTEYGQHDAELTAQTDDPSQPSLAVPIRGASDQSDLRIIPSTVDFGVVPVRCASPGRRVVLYNTGASAVQVNRFSLDPATTPEMRIEVAPGLPLRLGGGDSAELELRYRPTDIGPDTGLLFVDHSAASVASAVPMVGEGQVDPTVTDTFSQLPSPQVDVLFVVDNSGSMSEEQGSLGSNLESFLGYATSAGVDFHIGVVTTDVVSNRDSGRFRGNPRIIDPSTTSIAQVFRSTVRVGTGGSASERGLEAAYLALTDPLVNTHNAGFLRRDAALALIFVSDEPDHSSRTVSFYEGFFRNLKGFNRPGMLSVSAVVGTQSPRCQGPGGRASYAPRYIELAQNTGGVVESICSANWGQTLSNIGLSSFGLRSRFTLSSSPVAATLRVRVDGSDVPRVDAAGATRWQYDPAQRVLGFTPGHVPPEGASIEVSYAVACL